MYPTQEAKPVRMILRRQLAQVEEFLRFLHKFSCFHFTSGVGWWWLGLRLRLRWWCRHNGASVAAPQVAWLYPWIRGRKGNAICHFKYLFGWTEAKYSAHLILSVKHFKCFVAKPIDRKNGGDCSEIGGCSMVDFWRVAERKTLDFHQKMLRSLR